MQERLPHAICGAKTRSGEPCKGKPMLNGRCRMHGGNSRASIAHPNYKRGKYDGLMPGRMRDRYRDALQDPERLHLSHEIALVDARLGDVLERVDTGESGASWRALDSAWQDFQNARKEQNQDRRTEKMNVALADIRRLIEQGLADYAAWDEVVSLALKRKALVESERKRYVEMGQMITAAQGMALVTRLTEIIAEHVTDPQQRVAISKQLVRIVSTDTSRQPSAD